MSRLRIPTRIPRWSRDDLRVGAGAAEQKTLRLVAAFGAQTAQLRFGFDALGGDGHAKSYAETR